MITLYGSTPGWTVPCLGPMVTKLAYYMTLAGIAYTFVPTDLSQLDRDSPNGKVPFIDDENGNRMADSTLIIDHLRQKYGDALDRGVTPREEAQMVAFNRLVDEHLYWIAVVQPRYVDDGDWHRYLCMIANVTELPPEVKAFGDAWRARVLNGFNNGGWTRLSAEVLYARGRTDIDALSDQLGDRPFFMGDKPRWIDATVLSILRHTIDAPFSFDTKHYGASKRNLVDYMARMKSDYGI
ncbi:MAG: isoI [Panacagrimonas sp.]|jgi:glutathione S-transferase|nr:glutathione S-transferase C-terminal domain-containing protein [Panacagrimonas sp.]MCC2659006.1 isoI [Panacagrimonas sp.]